MLPSITKQIRLYNKTIISFETFILHEKLQHTLLHLARCAVKTVFVFAFYCPKTPTETGDTLLVYLRLIA